MEYFVPTFKHGFYSINVKQSLHTDTFWECARKNGGMNRDQKAQCWEHASAGLHQTLKVDRVFKKFGHGLRKDPKMM